MATQRVAPPMASFFKWTAIGQMIVGKVDDYRTTDNGPFIRVRPAMIRESSGAALEMYDGVAVGLTTDMRQKINGGDKGRFLLVRFEDTEPTKKGSPRKIFVVEELSYEEITELAATANRTHRSEQYSGRDDESARAANAASDDGDDELPF